MYPYPLSDDLVLVENAAILPRSSSLVIADLQLGYEQQLRALGHNVVYEQATRMLDLLERLIAEHAIRRLIINGDLKHEFGTISSQERRDILGMLSKLQRTIEIVVVKGNHDIVTKPLTDRLGLALLEGFAEGGFLMVHGHEEPSKELLEGIHTVIIGHLHPAITLSDGVRSERYKCFLVGKYEGKRLVVLPSFSTIVEGTDVLRGEPHSPLLSRRSLERAQLFVAEDGIRQFGEVRRLRRMIG